MMISMGWALLFDFPRTIKTLSIQPMADIPAWCRNSQPRAVVEQPFAGIPHQPPPVAHCIDTAWRGKNTHAVLERGREKYDRPPFRIETRLLARQCDVTPPRVAWANFSVPMSIRASTYLPDSHSNRPTCLSISRERTPGCTAKVAAAVEAFADFVRASTQRPASADIS